MNFLHLGACVGNLETDNEKVRCGFTEFIKRNYKINDNIFLVEANPRNINKLKICYKNYKNVKFFNIGISVEKKPKIDFYYTEDDAPSYMVCSTKIEHVIKHYPKSNIKKFTIENMSITNFLDENFKNKKIDYLSIDLEGIDYDILMNLPLDKYEIENISIEYIHLKKYQIKKMIKYLYDKKYSYCGFGYDHNNFDFLFKKKKIFTNYLISNFISLISKKHIKYLNYFIKKN